MVHPAAKGSVESIFMALAVAMEFVLYFLLGRCFATKVVLSLFLMVSEVTFDNS